MTKRMRELMAQRDNLRTEARALLGENKIAEAEAKAAELRELDRKIKLEEQLDDDEAGDRRSGQPAGGAPEKRDAAKLESEYQPIFFKALRRKNVSAEERSIAMEYRAMHAGGVATDPDGDSGIIVPSDVQTRINEIMRSLNDLSAVFAHEDVVTMTGSRVLEKDEDMTPFAVINEMANIDETDNPKFVGVNYSLAKRGGILPLTNDLLKSSDQNVQAHVTKWIAKKHVVTKNTILITQLNTLAKVALADFNAIKKVLNVTLDPAISNAASILTNQDGYQWMDEQVDGNNRPLLTDDITQPGRKLFKGKPVVVMANRFLPSDTSAGTKAPMIIGNLRELLVHFSMGAYELLSTKEGGDAFKRDTTDLRVITYDDARKWDTGSAVFGQLTIS
jgi:HK97 family phage major capsid protein